MDSRGKSKKPQVGQFFDDFDVKYLQIETFSESFSCLVPTSGQKPKKLLEPFFEKNIEVYDFGLILDLFANISKSRIFFKNPAL